MGERHLEDSVTCMSHHVHRLLHGVLLGVGTHLFSPPASDGAGSLDRSGDRRGCCSVQQAPHFCTYVESLWTRVCGSRFPKEA